ncbi:MAG TPA: gliding motility-associated C-terminal domain-containing protein [Bacteroidales bacterium]|nr:gliding motility-associated C-terminal domain-containing protein [Bacteroidales bacterium]
MTAVCTIGEQTPYETYDEFTAAGGSAMDNCSINEDSFEWVNDITDGQNCPETVTRTYLIEDLCGNIATCSQTITINDEVPPSIDCPPALTAECNITEQPPYVSFSEFIAAGGVAADNCSIDEDSFLMTGQTEAPGECPKIYTRTYQIADLCGNITTCTQIITVNDQIPPVLDCPADLTASCTISEQPPYSTFSEFTAAGGTTSDNCGIAVATFSLTGEVTDGNVCPETVTRIYQIEDLCGNLATCTQHIIIHDLIPPAIVCPGSLSAVCDISEKPAYTDYPAFIAAGGTATDNCDIDPDSFTLLDEVSDDNTCPETVTRTYQIADLCGNVATCTQAIIIHDLVPPVMACPAPVTAVCDISEQPPYTFSQFTIAGGTASDNCGIDEDSFTWLNDVSDGQSCPEVIQRTYQVADLCGNVTSCTQTITIDDEIPPALSCPGPLTIECEIADLPPYPGFTAFIADGGMASDNCGIDEDTFYLVSQEEAPGDCPKIYTRTYGIADLCGNITTCTQTITVNDLIPPAITCPGPIEADCDIQEQQPYDSFAAFVNAGGSASDNCAINEDSFTWVNDVSGSTDCPKIMTRTYRIADMCGNTATCTQIVTIDDKIPPALACPPPVNAVCTINEVPPYEDFDAFLAAGGTASDNCNIEPDSFTFLDEYSDNNSCPETFTRIYQIEDLCGNAATCTHTVLIHDLLSPVITSPNPLTAVCTISEILPYSTYAEFTSAGGNASDNCDLDISSFSWINDISDGQNCPEMITRIYQIADLCGNTATCTQSITIYDDIAPVLSCPGPLTIECDINDQPPYADFAAFVAEGGSASDNCDIEETSLTMISQTVEPGDCPKVFTRTYQIADLCGNTATCTQSITVNDITPPEISCPGPIEADCNIQEQTPYQTFDEFVNAGGTAMDNCEIDEGSFAWITDESSSTDCPKVITRTYGITDLCGNTATCTQVITIDDEIPPVINCPPALSATCDISEIPPYSDFGAFSVSGGTATDNCAIDPGSFALLSEVSDNNECPETVTRTYQIMDLCGNPSSCTQLIIIHDQADPVLSCPDLTVDCAENLPPAYSSLEDFIGAGGSANDYCGIDPATFILITEVIAPPGPPSPYQVLRTYGISDLCGNTDTCLQVIDVPAYPWANAGQDAVICSNQSYPLSGSSNMSTVLWSTSGTGTFDQPNSLSATYTPGQEDISSGSVILTLTAITSGNCEDASDDMVLTILPAPTAFAGADASICEGESFMLSDASAGNFSLVTWTTSGDGSFNNANEVNTYYLPGPADIFAGIVTLTLTATGEGPCSFTNDSMILSITGAPEAYAGEDDGICVSQGSYTLAGNASDYTSVYWATSGTGTFTNQNTLTATYTPGVEDINAGTVTLTLTANGGGTCGDSSDVMILTIWPDAIADAGPDAGICEGESYTLTGATASHYTVIAWTTTGSGTFSDPTIVNSTYQPGQADIDAGFVVLTLTATGTGTCPPAISSMTLSITGAPAVNAGPDGDICASQNSYQVSGTATDYTSVMWTTSGTGSFTNPGSLITTYSLSASDKLSSMIILTLTVNGNGECGEFSDGLFLTIWQDATADAGSDAAVCGLEPYTLSSAYASDYVTLHWASSGTGAFDNQFAMNPTYTPSPADVASGSADLTLTASGGGTCPDATDSMTLTITGPPAANAGSDTTICTSTLPFPLQGTAISYSSVLWTTIGDGSFSDPTSLTAFYIPGTSDLIAGVTVLTLTVEGNGTCGSASDNMTLFFTMALTAYAGENEYICEGESFTLADATASEYSSLTWTTSGMGAFNDNTILNPVYTPGPEDINAGSVSLVLTAQENSGICPPVSDTLLLFITGAPAAWAGNDSSICSIVNTLELSGSVINSNDILWTSTGTGSFDDPSLLNATYSISQADANLGMVLLILTAQGNGSCGSVSDTMNLIIWKAPAVYAGMDASICEGETYYIADATASDYSFVSWTSSFSSGYFDNPNAVNPTYTPGPEDITNGGVMLVLTAQGSLYCPLAADTIHLSITQAPTANAGADTAMCTSEISITLAGSAFHYSSILWTTRGNGTFSDPSILTPTYTPDPTDINAGLVTLTLTSSGNGTCEPVSDSLLLTIIIAPMAYAGDTTAICEGDTVLLTEAYADHYDSLLWTTTGDGSFSDATILNPEYIPGPNDIVNGTVELTLTATGAGPCPVTASTMPVSITGAPVASAGLDTTMCTSETSITLAGSASHYSFILWTTSGNGIFNDPSILTPTYTPDPTDINAGLVTLTLTSFGNGTCEPVSDSLLLTIIIAPMAYAGDTTAICEGDTVLLTEAYADHYDSLLWTTTGDGSFSDATILNPEYIPGPNDIVNGTVELTLTATGAGPCPVTASTMPVSITGAPVASAGVDSTMCSSEISITLAGTASFYSSLLWTTSGNGTFSDSSILTPTYTPDLTDIQTGLVTLTMTSFGNGSCGSVSDAMTLTIILAATADAGDDAAICEGDSYQLSGASADNFISLIWTTSGTGSFDDDQILNPTYTPGSADVAAGSVQLTLTAAGTGSCPPAVSGMTLTITGAPVAGAGEDAVICASEGSYTLNGTAVNDSSIVWTTSGTGTFSDTSSLTTVYTPSQEDINAGSVLLTLTAYGNGSCPDASDSMTLTIIMAATADAGDDAAVCEGDSFWLSAASANNYISLLWTTSGTGSFDDDQLLNPTYTPGSADVTAGSVQLTLTAASSGSCPPAVSGMTLTITGAPVAGAGEDAAICASEGSYTLNGTAVNDSSIVWTTSGTGTFSDTASLTTVYTPSQEDINAGSVVLTLTAYGNGSCPDASDAMTLTIIPASTADAGDDAAICEGDSFWLSGASANNYISLLWTTSGTGSFDDDQLLNPTYTPGSADVTAGSVQLTLTAASSGSCPPAVSGMTLTITGAPVAGAGEDAAICASEGSYTLNGTAVNDSSIVWTTSGTGTFSDTASLTTVYTPSQEDINAGSAVLTLTAYGNGSCPDASDSMTLTIIMAATADAGDDAAICEGDSFLLSGAAADNYISLLWTTSGTGSFDNDQLMNPTYTPGSADVTAGLVQLTLTAASAGSCPPAVSGMTLTITGAPVANAGEDASTCSDGYVQLSGSAIQSSSVLWTAAGDGSFDDPTLLTPTYTPGLADSVAGQIILTMTAFGNGSCPPASDAMVLTIVPQAVVFAGVNDSICEGDSYLLAGAAHSHTTGLLWTSGGNGTFDDITALHPVYTPGSDDIQAGTVSLILTSQSIPPCDPVSDTMTLVIMQPVSVFAGADNETCRRPGATWTLSDADAGNYGELLWTTSGSGTFDDPTALHPVYSLSVADMDAGAVILTLTATGQGDICPPAASAMTLHITMMDIEATVAQASCEEAPDGSVQLSAEGGSLPYSFVLNGITDAGGLFGGLLPGTYDYQVTDSEGCYAEGTVTVGVLDDISPEILCPSAITVNTDEGECFALEIDPGVPVATDNCGVASVTSDFLLQFPTGQVPQGTHLVTWTVTDIHGNITTCGQELTVTDNEPPLITCQDIYVSATGGDCSLFVSVPAPVVSDNCGVQSLVNSINGTGSASGVYPLGMTKITWTAQDIHGNTISCFSYITVVSDLDASDDYASTLDSSPVNIFILGNDLYCIGDNNPITVNVIEEPANGIYYLNSDIRFLDYIPDFGFYGVDSLKYELCDYTGACDTANVYIIVEYINDKPVARDDLDSTSMNIPVVIHQLANDHDPDGKIVNFEIIAPPVHGASIKIMVDSTILYSPFNNFTGTDQLIYAIFDDGNPPLSDTARVVIQVFNKDILPEPPFIIYNALTPNGDGINDYWKIKGIELFPNNKVVIMDRWGEIIAEFDHYDNVYNHWTGYDMDGNRMPNGTYYYFLTISDYDGFYKGWVFLYRE